MQQDPEFSRDLAHKIESEIPAVPPPPKSVRKKKIEDPTSRAFVQALVLHAFLFVSALLVHVISLRLGLTGESDEARRLRELKTAIRVDVVDLPKLKKIDLDKIDASQEVSNESSENSSAQKDKVNPQAMVDPTQAAKDREKRAKKRAAEKLKELKARLAADQKRREEIAKLRRKKAASSGRPELAGNIKSEGYSTTGQVATLADIYVGKAKGHLQRYWRVPGWMSTSRYQASVIVKLSPSGSVVYKKLNRTSGSNDFDRSVIRAVENADPFPVPPAGLRLQVLKDGIEFGFPN